MESVQRRYKTRGMQCQMVGDEVQFFDFTGCLPLNTIVQSFSVGLPLNNICSGFYSFLPLNTIVQYFTVFFFLGILFEQLFTICLLLNNICSGFYSLSPFTNYLYSTLHFVSLWILHVIEIEYCLFVLLIFSNTLLHFLQQQKLFDWIVNLPGYVYVFLKLHIYVTCHM